MTRARSAPPSSRASRAELGLTLRDALQRCKRSPPTRWPAAARSLVGGDDLASAAVEGRGLGRGLERGRKVGNPVAGVGGREDARGTRGFLGDDDEWERDELNDDEDGEKAGPLGERANPTGWATSKRTSAPCSSGATTGCAKFARFSRALARRPYRSGRTAAGAAQPAAVRAATETRRLSPRNRRGCGRSRPGRPRSPSDEARSPSERAARGPQDRCGCRRSPSPAASPRRGARR